MKYKHKQQGHCIVFLFVHMPTYNFSLTKRNKQIR